MQLLDELARRFEDAGLAVRHRSFFGPGFMVFDARVFDEASRHAVRAGLPVNVYSVGHAVELRVTLHGGPHWVLQVADAEVAVAEVTSFFADPKWPPGPSWVQV
ncbi:MAG: hypothetical protein KC464_27575 [Myxococcales bacterium]|nr:hypothetical protein [Myxococcales bacterium]